MTWRKIIKKTIDIIRQLPPDKAEEISDFAAFIKKKYGEDAISNNIQKLVLESHVFDFLNEEEDLYSFEDLKIYFN